MIVKEVGGWREAKGMQSELLDLTLRELDMTLREKKQGKGKTKGNSKGGRG